MLEFFSNGAGPRRGEVEMAKHFRVDRRRASIALAGGAAIAVLYVVGDALYPHEPEPLTAAISGFILGTPLVYFVAGILQHRIATMASLATVTAKWVRMRSGILVAIGAGVAVWGLGASAAAGKDLYSARLCQQIAVLGFWLTATALPVWLYVRALVLESTTLKRAIFAVVATLVSFFAVRLLLEFIGSVSHLGSAVYALWALLRILMVPIMIGLALLVHAGLWRAFRTGTSTSA